PPPGFSNNTGPATFTPVGDNSQIAASLITSQLNAGANVTLDTGGAGSPGAQAGDIRVLAAIDKTVANPASLALKAFHDVQINQPISIASAFGPTGFGTLTIDAGNRVVVSAPITTQGGGLNIRAGEFVNQSAINNGVGGDLKPGMAIFADRFTLAGGTINGGQGSVGLFTRTATNSVGVESAGDTTISNADIASVTLSPDSPSTNANQLLIGVGSAGAMRIGDNAQVNGGSKNLVFSAGGGAGTRVTVGANGVTTTGDLVVDATGGAIGGTGTIGGNRVQLIASTGIGTSTARVGTAAGTLAARTTGGSAFIAEADNVRLGAVTIAGRTVTNGVAPGNAYDLTANGNVAVDGVVNVGGRLNLNAGGTLSLNGAGASDSQLISTGGQTISARAVAMNAQDTRRAIIQNNASGNQTLTVGAGGIDMNVVAGAGVAQIINNGANAGQTVSTAGALNVVGGSGSGSTNSGLFTGLNVQQTVNAGSISLRGATAGNSGGAFISNTNPTNTLGSADQTINVTGGITVAGGANGLSNRAGIVTNGNQTITGNPDIALTGGASGTGTGTAGTANSAFIQTNGTGKQQTINAGTITVTAGTGGTDTSATIVAGKQSITTTGDVLISGGGGGGDLNGARIGGLGGGTPSNTDLTLHVGRDLVISGGSANGASVGSTVAAAMPHTIDITAGRDVLLNASSGAPVRIGTSFNFAPATGDIKVSAGRDIRLNGAAQQAAIRTASNVELGAGGSIVQNFNGLILANRLKTTSGADQVLTGPNAITSFDGTSTAGNVAVNNTTSLDVAGISTPGSASVVVTGDITESGAIQAGSLATSSSGATTLAGANQIAAYTGTSGGNLTLHNAASMVINGPVSSSGALVLDVDGTLSVTAAGTQDAVVHSFGGQTITARAAEVSARDGRTASLWNTGPGSQSVTASNGAGVDVVVGSGGGLANIQADAGSSQSVAVIDGDHINVNAASGNAFITVLNTAQTLSIT
ncbi:MAG TPA: hypothetical protein VN903_11510, partial [Polyangia bacterium]|nr:hypothetical protein [Polyangia bacterium]